MRTAFDARGCGFEAIEPRMLLAAGTLVSVSNDAVSLGVVVDYVGIDESTLGPGDVTFAANGRAAVPATSVTSITHRTGGVTRVGYRLPAYDAAWGTSDTGTYVITTPAGAVQATNGDSLSNTSLGSVWLWFGNPKARLVGQQIRTTDWLVTMRYDSLNGMNESTIIGPDLILGGGQSTWRVVASITHLSSTSIQVVYSIGAPGGAWSFASNGTYTLSVTSVAQDNGARSVTPHLLASYYLWFNTPKVQIDGAPSVTTTDWIIPVRITPAPGEAINPAALVSDGSLTLAGPGGYVGQGHMASITLNPDSSYTVTMRFSARGGTWDSSDNGTYTLRVATGRVVDVSGHAAAPIQLGQYPFAFTAPSATMVLPTFPTHTNWNIGVDFTDDGSVDMTSIRAGTIRVEGPDGTVLPVTLSSVAFGFPGIVHAVFNISVPSGLDNGRYRVFVNDAAMQDTDGNTVAENLLGSFWLWF